MSAATKKLWTVRVHAQQGDAHSSSERDFEAATKSAAHVLADEFMKEATAWVDPALGAIISVNLSPVEADSDHDELRPGYRTAEQAKREHEALDAADALRSANDLLRRRGEALEGLVVSSLDIALDFMHALYDGAPLDRKTMDERLKSAKATVRRLPPVPAQPRGDAPNT